jgi:hypothetical protein
MFFCAGDLRYDGRVKRLPRILLDATAAASLLLCVAGAVLWVRSYRVVDRVIWDSTRDPEYFDMCDSASGVLTVNLPWAYRLSSVNQRGWYGFPANALAQRVHRQWIDRYTWHGFEWRSVGPLGQGTKPVRYRYEISVPHGLIVLCTALLPAGLLYRRLRGARDIPGRCAQCGYDLRATPDRCPVCGTITVAPAAPGSRARPGD